VRVRLKLYAALAVHLPPGAEANVATVDVDGEATPWAILDRFGVPREQAHLVMINGTYVAPESRGEQLLADGDSLAVWPPVAGG